MRAVAWAVIAASFALILWVMFNDHEAAMNRCLEKMSQDTCVYVLR